MRPDAHATFSTERVYYGITALVRFEKDHRCVISFADPLPAETVQFGGRPSPLAADFTVPLAVILASENPKRLELARCLRPGSYANTARLTRRQPCDSNSSACRIAWMRSRRITAS